jgi:hypothetical protein
MGEAGLRPVVYFYFQMRKLRERKGRRERRAQLHA